MESFLLTSQFIISAFLIIIILIQNKDGGLSAMMGGGGSFQTTKRGAEKVIHYMTITLAVLFILNGLLFVFF